MKRLIQANQETDFKGEKKNTYSILQHSRWWEWQRGAQKVQGKMEEGEVK